MPTICWSVFSMDIDSMTSPVDILGAHSYRFTGYEPFALSAVLSHFPLCVLALLSM